MTNKELVDKIRETASWNPSVVCRRLALQAADVIEELERQLATALGKEKEDG